MKVLIEAEMSDGFEPNDGFMQVTYRGLIVWSRTVTELSREQAVPDIKGISWDRENKNMLLVEFDREPTATDISVVQRALLVSPITSGAAVQDTLRERVIEAFKSYERFGAACELEGQPMINAAYLEEFYELAIAPPAPAADEQSQPRSVYCVGNKTASMYFASKANAEKVVASSSPATGLQVTEIPLLDAINSQPAQVVPEENYEQRFNQLMALLQDFNGHEHGLCKPRDRRACTICNAKDDIYSLLSEWEGPRIYAQSPPTGIEG